MLVITDSRKRQNAAAKAAFEQRLGILAGSAGPDFQVMPLPYARIATSYFAGEEGMSPQIKGLVFALLLVGVSAGAVAGSSKENRKLVESSLLVKGDIVIAPDGSVQAYTLESKEGLGEGLENFLDNKITHWRFKPVEVDGKVVTAKAPMSLRLIATPEISGNNMSVRIASTWFGGQSDEPATDRLSIKKIMPPKYPKEAILLGGQGTVYLVLLVGRDGRVLAADVEKVNLLMMRKDDSMRVLRKLFAKAATSFARQWEFTPPTTGTQRNDANWKSRFQVDFKIPAPYHSVENGWETYVVDPEVHDIPWAREELQAAGSPDALPGVGLYSLRQDIQLLTAPNP